MTIAKTDLWDDRQVTAFVTLRDTGMPGDPYAGFNACHYTGDDADHIESCRQALCSTLGITPGRLVMPRQTHSANVALIDRVPDDGTVVTPDNTDALVTTQRRVALAINTADCVPLLLHDPEAGVIAAVHSGWRGTVSRIAALTVDRMLEAGASPHSIHAAMGPCICKQCFETGEEVAALFRQSFPPGTVIDSPGRRPHVDLAAAIKATLTDCGLRPENISLPQACSRCRSDLYFSARRLGIRSGRTLSVIMMR